MTCKIQSFVTSTTFILQLQAISYSSSWNTVTRSSFSSKNYHITHFLHNHNSLRLRPSSFSSTQQQLGSNNINYFMNNICEYNSNNMPKYGTRSRTTSATSSLSQRQSDDYNIVENDNDNGINNNESFLISEQENKLNAMKVIEIKHQLKLLGLKVSGNKSELINRLLDDVRTNNDTRLLFEGDNNNNSSKINDVTTIQQQEAEEKYDDDGINNKISAATTMNPLSTPIIKTKTTSLTKVENDKISNIVTPDVDVDADESSYNNDKDYHSKTKNPDTKRRRNIISTYPQQQEELIESDDDSLSTSKYKKVSISINNKNVGKNNDIMSNLNSIPYNETITSAAITITTNNTNAKVKTEKKKKVQRKLQLPSSSDNIILPPDNWEYTYSLVEELRKDKTAPVDNVGAEVLPERHRGDVIFRFQVLICLMLSSQTKDAVVGETIQKLQKVSIYISF